MNAAQETPIRVGIAGLGRSGWDIHAKTLGPMTGKYQVVAVADLIPARREEAKARFGCKTFRPSTIRISGRSTSTVSPGMTS